MPAKWHKYSYSAQRAERRTILSIVFLIVFLTLLFAFINANLVTMYTIESATMEPSVHSGDYVLTSPLYRKVPGLPRHFSLLITPQRGDMIVVGPAYRNDTNTILRGVNALVSFLTFQRLKPFNNSHSWGEKPVIRRLLAFPGDSVYMENFTLHVKTGDSSHYLTESEISGTSYDIKLDTLPENWTADLPLSGSFPEIILKENQYFILCDNRLNASDSRVWGPIGADRIQGKVILRYWPFDHFTKL